MKTITLHADGGAFERGECVLVVPERGRQRIAVDGDGVPRIARPGERAATTEMVVERARRGRADVLVVAERSHALRVNGAPAPLLAVLSEGDELRLGDGTVLRVGAREGPRVVTVDAELAGAPCPVCRTKLAAGRRAYRCTSCGRAMHLDGHEVEASARLECASVVGACPSCQTRVSLDPGGA